jgi:N6-L-threonylcarbamoyladenine synthase
MGEAPDHVVTIGNPALDALRHEPLMSREALEESLGFSLGAGFLLVTLHPTRGGEDEARALAQALAQVRRKFIVLVLPIVRGFPPTIMDGKLLSNVLATQAIHAFYGGVVPELASRAHTQVIAQLAEEALKKAGITKNELTAVASTQGPGLLGALMVACNFAKGMAMALDVPLIGVNHMKAHILAHFLQDNKPTFPFLCLTVSGGHTQLVKVESPLEMEILGQTQDDAVGEAFDKSAKLLGLPYPGGPEIDKWASTGNPKAFAFPIPEMQGFNFSFSGIKTAILYFLKGKEPQFIEDNKADICASIQYTLVEMLLVKVRKAVKATGITQVAIAGGVAANAGLRQTLLDEGEKRVWQIFLPEKQYCTDNAAMIAQAAWFTYKAGIYQDIEFTADPALAW